MTTQQIVYLADLQVYTAEDRIKHTSLKENLHHLLIDLHLTTDIIGKEI